MDIHAPMNIPLVPFPCHYDVPFHVPHCALSMPLCLSPCMSHLCPFHVPKHIPPFMSLLCPFTHAPSATCVSLWATAALPCAPHLCPLVGPSYGPSYPVAHSVPPVCLHTPHAPLHMLLPSCPYACPLIHLAHPAVSPPRGCPIAPLSSVLPRHRRCRSWRRGRGAGQRRCWGGHRPPAAARRR